MPEVLEPAGQILAAAYLGGRERDRAIGWLVWIAGQMGAGRDLAWWEIPDWIGESGLRPARALTGAVPLGNRLRPGKLRRARAPQAMVPRWPRSVRHLVVLALALVTGLFLRRTLIALWARPVADWPRGA